ncbi:unnamed protein product [Soboliphyme baturini]|uniref:Uncharacterized protein n=1 Tax=Soboliphyme baturini TaxID=241478 RepID=A0A183IMK4_9BILA|nr:unnamed protein product [Soboliphyme baturini]
MCVASLKLMASNASPFSLYVNDISVPAAKTTMRKHVCGGTGRPDRIGSDRIGSDRIGSDRIGSDRIKSDGTRPDPVESNPTT